MSYLTFAGQVCLDPIFNKPCSLGKLSLFNDNGEQFDYIEQTTSLVHDVEHIIFSLGFSQAEEDTIDSMSAGQTWVSDRHPTVDLVEWENLFISGFAEFYLAHEDLVGLQFVLTATFVNNKVSVDVTFY